MTDYFIPLEARGQIMAMLALGWDGQWFLKVYEKYGWQAAAEINARVRAAFARLEMRATLRALGKRRADDLNDAVAIWQAYLQMFGADAGAFAGEQIVQDNALYITVTRCAALDGSKRANLERADQSCIACESVWQAWFGALLPDCQFELDIVARMGYGAPQCRFCLRVLPSTCYLPPSTVTR